jgi:hypothetical protein
MYALKGVVAAACRAAEARSSFARRVGRATSSPPQFGHTLLSSVAQLEQKVHS